MVAELGGVGMTHGPFGGLSGGAEEPGGGKGHAGKDALGWRL